MRSLVSGAAVAVPIIAPVIVFGIVSGVMVPVLVPPILATGTAMMTTWKLCAVRSGDAQQGQVQVSPVRWRGRHGCSVLYDLASIEPPGLGW